MPEFERVDGPITIGVVGDTHRSSRSRRPLPQELREGLEACSLIFHTGDVNARWVLDELAAIAPVHAVAGNNDEDELLRELPLERYFEVGTLKVGLIHGHHPRLTARQYTYDRMRGVVDCVVYGHSHQPEVEEREGLLMVNPGSPTQKRFAPHSTFAMLTIDEEIHARIVRID